MKGTIVPALLIGLISASAFGQDQLGIGLIGGEPTGLSVKYWLDEEHAVDAAAAWSFWDGDGFQLHADYLWHNFDLLGSVAACDMLPVYCGVGARLKFWDDNGKRDDDRHTAFGIRVPVGISYLFDGAPFDIFAEIVPILDVAPDIELNLNIAVGLRFYVK
jgi:hypothetical protein